MRPEFQALLLTIPCILITAVAFDRDKRLTRVAVGDNAQLNQLLHNIRQAQLGVVKSIMDNQNLLPTNHTPMCLTVINEKNTVNTTEWNTSFVNALFLPSFNYTKVKAAVVSIQNNRTDATRNTLRSIYAPLVEQMQRDIPSDAKSPFDLAVYLNKTIFDGNWNAAIHFIMSLFASQNETQVDDFFRALRE